MLDRDVHPEKVCDPILVTLFGMIILVKDTQSLNAPVILVIPSGMMKLVNDVHPLNASSIFVILLGNVTDFNVVQLSKAPSPINLTLSGII